jgi:hypothetical protein
MKYIFICLLLLPFVYTNAIYAKDDVFEHLLGAKCLKCSFKEGVSTTWHAKAVKIESDQWKADTIFDSIDFKQGKARCIGNQGASDITLIGSPSGITFIENTGIGNMVFTTVFPFYKPGAVHWSARTSRPLSRNVIRKSLSIKGLKPPPSPEIEVYKTYLLAYMKGILQSDEH